MLFGTQKLLSKLNDSISLFHNGIKIRSTDNYKYLGVNLTSSLNMTHHLSESIRKASTRIRLLKKTRNFMDTKTASLVYQTMIMPLFTYCSLCLYGATPSYLKQRFHHIESRAEQIIGGSVPKREEVLKKRICAFVHRCLHKTNTCGIFEDYFKFKNTNINTRNNGNTLEIPAIKLEAAKASFKFQGIKLFNSLSKSARTELDFVKFKKLL